MKNLLHYIEQAREQTHNGMLPEAKALWFGYYIGKATGFYIGANAPIEVNELLHGAMSMTDGKVDWDHTRDCLIKAERLVRRAIGEREVAA